MADVAAVRLEDLVSVAKAAELCGLSKSTIRRWMRENKVRKFKAGRRTLASKQELETYIGSSSVAPASVPVASSVPTTQFGGAAA